MTLEQLFILLKKVFTTPEVIAVTVVIALYINILTYIVRYRKHSPRPKHVRPSPKAPVEAKSAKDDEQDEEAEEEDEPKTKSKSRKKK